ncbi:MAG: indolepyruvate oxidoreductase subunit beta [Bacteroidales bacterium]|nr:indolepyruvate oxidoreductase subunit beta [Bacteroidales bacterium]
MKKDIILAGVGGQGIISLAAIIGLAALNKGMYLKQSEVHGMSQRGGDVMSNLRISDNPIYSDLIPCGQADLIISLEPMESLRYLPYLNPHGWLIANKAPYVNIPNYPNLDDIYKEITRIEKHVLIPADELAKEIGNEKVVNMIVLGASAPHLGFGKEEMLDAIRQMFKNKGEDVVNQNIQAFEIGYNFKQN